MNLAINKDALFKLYIEADEEERKTCNLDSYRSTQIARFVIDKRARKEPQEHLTFAADWFEHDNVAGRDPRGEADFEAIRLVYLYYSGYEDLSDRTKKSLDRFFLERNFSSIYDSENHSLMYRVARYLAAQFYLGSGKIFKQFDEKSAEDMFLEDEAFIFEFLDFRARYGWGEFDSCCYAAEEMSILIALYNFAKDEKIKELAAMSMDIILLDMICDSKGGLYGGAHGRIYPRHALDTKNSAMYYIYKLYFGTDYDNNESLNIPVLLAASDYRPSDIVYEIEKNRQFPYVNIETKHLHSLSAWNGGTNGGKINYKNLEKLKNCFITKRTYVDERYILGSVNHQDAYPSDMADGGYAHHQQHEWELTLPGGTDRKIFSHHPGDPGYHHIHNRFTGDWGCLCSTHYTNNNTAISMYSITKPDEFPYINAVVPLKYFSEKIFDENYLFLKYDGLYISLYFSNGYRVNKEDEYKDIEILSDGRYHAVVLRIEYDEKFESLEKFAEHIKSLPVKYDKEAGTVDFDGIHVYYHGNSENGKENIYPTGMLFDSPYVKSKWGSGVIEVKCGEKKKIYDFNKFAVK